MERNTTDLFQNLESEQHLSSLLKEVLNRSYIGISHLKNIIKLTTLLKVSTLPFQLKKNFRQLLTFSLFFLHNEFVLLNTDEGYSLKIPALTELFV